MSNIKSPLFFHVRSPMFYNAEEGMNDASRPLDERNYFRKIRDDQAKLGYTLAFELRDDGWHCAYAHTTTKKLVNKNGKTVQADTFCRRIGRAIALGRLRCRRKNLSQYFGTEPPTWEDAVVLVELIKRIEFSERLEDIFQDRKTAGHVEQRAGIERSRSQAYRLRVQERSMVTV